MTDKALYLANILMSESIKDGKIGFEYDEEKYEMAKIIANDSVFPRIIRSSNSVENAWLHLEEEENGTV